MESLNLGYYLQAIQNLIQRGSITEAEEVLSYLISLNKQSQPSIGEIDKVARIVYEVMKE